MSAKSKAALDLLVHALELGPPEREQFLRDACGEDRELIATVQRLLALEDEASRFLETTGPSLVAGGSTGVVSPDVSGSVPNFGPTGGAMTDRLGEFRILGSLGEGGMGRVYLAEQESLGRRVALKVIRPEYQGSPGVTERFHREARAIARLRHPNIVVVHGFGETDGVCYLAMDLVEGRSLEEVVEEAEKKGERVEMRRLVRWTAEIARALAYTHEAGIVHRDVKPANIRINPEDHAILVDFGLVREVGQETGTLTHAFVGSPCYASPEQVASASHVDGRSDVFSLGATLYRALTGHVPFLGESIEGTLHLIVSVDPQPPRKRNPLIPRDLDVVTLKALEKQRERRYASAAAFAEDLEAILELRPIRARPPGPCLRLAKWAHRRPTTAAALATACLAVVAAVFVLGIDRRMALEERRGQARSAVAEARQLLVKYRQGRESTGALEGRIDEIRRLLEFQYLPPQDYAELERRETEVAGIRREREETFYEVLNLLDQARRFDPDIAGVDAVRAELHVEKLREALAVQDEARVKFYRQRILEQDPSGGFLKEVFPTSTFRVRSEPPGAEVYLFRYREQSEIVAGGEPRLVPVPVKGASPLRPGTWCLRIVTPAGEVTADDLIVDLEGHPIEATLLVTRASGQVQLFDRLHAVDGKVVRDRWELEHALRRKSASGSQEAEKEFEFERRGERFRVRTTSWEELGVEVMEPQDVARRGGCHARLLREGELRSVVLPAGLEVRRTAAPLVLSPAACSGTTPLETVLDPGEYVALLRLDGYERLRVSFGCPFPPGDIASVTLVPNRTAPPGFVRIVLSLPAGAASVWVMDREVTCAEYLEFLNAPATLAAIDASGQRVFIPRSGQTAWSRGQDGRFSLPQRWRADWPVAGVSYDDAVAYAEWLTRKAREAGLQHEYRLPTRLEAQAAVGPTKGPYVYGPRFRPVWTNTNHSRPVAGLEPVLSYPIDETRLGVFDLGGSVWEWRDDWYDRERGLRRISGGGWATANAELLKIWSDFYSRPDQTSFETGFRLVLRIHGE